MGAKKITKRDLAFIEGKTVYLEKSDCSYWDIQNYNELHNGWHAVNSDTGEKGFFKAGDLLGNYLI